MAKFHDAASTKLKAHYPSFANAGIMDLLSKFRSDNPTFGTQLGTPAFYSKTPSESWNDAAARFWAAYVP